MDTRGLTEKEASKRLEKYGSNEIREVSKNTPFKIFLRQINGNFVNYLLFFAMIASFFVGKTITGYTIMFTIILVIVIGFIQEYKAEEALKSLKNLIMPVSIIIREGKEREELSKNLVPGDILVLRSGEKIPADCIILEQKDLLVNESILTGESKEVSKKEVKSELEYSEENELYMGSFIISGRCVCKITHTGMSTKFGKIAGLISGAEKELPLGKKVNRIAKFMAIIAVIVSISTGLLMLLRQSPLTSEYLVEVLILVIAISVSAFPQGFPVVLIMTLSSGVHKMAKQNAIVNRMSVVETLGETTVICSDKTGTITKGEMTVKKVFTDNTSYDVEGTGYEAIGGFTIDGKKVDVSKNNNMQLLFSAAVFCNDSKIERIGNDMEFKAIGTPTEAALLVMAAKAGIFKDDLEFKRIEEIPFNSDRKMMAVMGNLGREKYVFCKGAPEVLLERCEFVQRKDGVFRLNSKERERILSINKSLTDSAFRSLALAYKSPSSNKESLDQKLIFIGLAGLEDPPREEVKEALKMCKNAGINVKMITGDNKETAIAIASQIGLKGDVMEGKDIDDLSDLELRNKIKEIVVFARVKPVHKLRIVKALKENGEIVTMTGDGVNDAPALKESHIGIAMGKNGTDVSREVADLTLKDDNFVTIVHAIREGRTIFKNIRKFVTFQLGCNFAELAILFFGVILAPILGWQVPVLLALQILFMNLVTDNLPAMTLGFNPSSPDSMEEKPRRNAEILTPDLKKLLIFTGFCLAFFSLGAIYLSFNVYGNSFEYSRTVGFVALVMIEIASAYNYRSFRKGVVGRSLMVNRYLAYASIVSILSTILVIYTPGLHDIFGMVPISITGWLFSLIPAALLVLTFDTFKRLNAKKNWLELEH